jgi:hypothetical protein
MALAGPIAPGGEYDSVSASLRNGRAILSNGLIEVSYDLLAGTYDVDDASAHRRIIADASHRIGPWSSNTPGAKHTWIREPLCDANGMGASLLIASAMPHGPTLLLRISLYNRGDFLVLTSGLDNTTAEPIRIKTLIPLWGGSAFASMDTGLRFCTLDGNGGGARTAVDHLAQKRRSLNNLLLTFGAPGAVHSLVIGGFGYAEFEKWAEADRRATGAIDLTLWAEDPIGKRVDPGMRYLVGADRFYVDGMTSSPFTALERYADRLRLAQEVNLPVCGFPIVDTWCAQVPHFGGGEGHSGYRARNDSVGAVEEMECAVRSGFTRFAPVAVLLEPDLYDSDNQQGWWDDAHWQRGPGNRAKGADPWISSHGQFVAPYETAAKWAGAVRALGGIPMIYMQTGFRSQDYAEAFPGHMIFNQSDAPFLNAKGEQQYRDRDGKEPRKLGYDYTDPGFIAHMRDVWETLRRAGIQGCKFDYPDFPFTGWPTTGGLEDDYATTAMHYRTIFRLAHDGLGPDCFLHERTLDRGSDVTLGLVTSQRTEGDTDAITKAMITRNGLRWYKNRVVVDYDMDAKNPFHAMPANRDGQRAMLTMSYVVSGTLMIAPSFGRMTTEMLHDLSRLYPYHPQRQSARPLDAFSREYPQIYDYRIDGRAHQLTFCNHDAEAPAAIGVDLAGDAAEGAMGLDAGKRYYVYDFWNDAYLGRFPGTHRFEQVLRPGEARMMAVREVIEVPQVLATDRHLMQGLVDLSEVAWDARTRTLSGVSLVVGGEPYRVIIAGNGRAPMSAFIDQEIEASLRAARFGTQQGVQATCSVALLPGDDGIACLTIARSANGPVAWSVVFDGG